VIGTLVVKVMRGLGVNCDITVAEPSAFHADYVRKAGADRVINGGIIEKAQEITGGRAYKPLIGERILMGGFDKVFDVVAHRRTLNSALRVTKAMGTIVVLGIGKDARLDLTPLWLKIQNIKGAYAYGYNESQGTKRHAFEMALEMMGRGDTRVEDMLTHKFAIDEYQEMIEVSLQKDRYQAIKTAIAF